jgi:hypothetical protein
MALETDALRMETEVYGVDGTASNPGSCLFEERVVDDSFNPILVRGQERRRQVNRRRGDDHLERSIESFDRNVGSG